MQIGGNYPDNLSERLPRNNLLTISMIPASKGGAGCDWAGRHNLSDGKNIVESQASKDFLTP